MKIKWQKNEKRERDEDEENDKFIFDCKSYEGRINSEFVI